ncbi:MULTISPECIES: DUF7619 domain-containing protein [Flavobacterium]|uniref:T9SS type A sorting domain-containing protein n=1 Tax=Flavobacterium TaxID=237 RepID=UPI001FCB41E8|nr:MULTISPECIES: T9SS type A sorting domain-containing protein [Flavobacterium]UOK41855.1 T9SS type A sorting domain-containing protein [Flavobacterium enshiense]
MKKIYFLLLALGLFTVVNGQNVYIEDYEFKTLLLGATPGSDVVKDIHYNSITLDANGDNEIQVSEALLVGYILVPNERIASLVGIRSFTNLKWLECGGNRLTSLDLSGLTNLVELHCIGNMITSLNLDGLNSLKVVECSSNQLANLSLNGPLLTRLKCEDNRLTSLTVNFADDLPINADLFFCNNNQLTSLNFTGNFKELRCSNNLLTQLDISTVPSLKIVYCDRNRLTSLNVTGSTSIEEIHGEVNQLTSLDFIPTSSLSFSKLKTLSIGHNQITSLDLSLLTKLSSLHCVVNQLTVLDVNLNVYLSDLYCGGNPLLRALLVKKQTLPARLEFQDCPNLNFICVKDSDIPAIQQKLNTYGYTNCTINSYCTFTPAGTFYRLKGNNKFSLSGDCNGSGNPLPFLRFNITGGSNSRTVIADDTGAYDIPFQSGTYTVTPFLNGNPNYFIKNPSVLNITFPASSNPYIKNFCVSPNYSIPTNDLEIKLLPMVQARPGFNCKYRIIYKNNGNSVQSGTINLGFDDAVLNLISTSSPTANQTTNNLSWNFTNLQPFETKEIGVLFSLNSPTQSPPVIMGDVLYFNSSITSSLTENSVSDNSFNYAQTVVNSFDPNDKTCLEGATIAPSEVGKYVHYMIRFENTGTFPAENIVVKDMIDTNKFDVNSLVPIKGSHPFVTNITSGNKVEFIFENINLPFDDANNDGYVAFKIKTKPTLANGDTFSNNASIYFDYNFPIVTNTATTTIQALSTQDFGFDQYFSLYPNPVKDVLNIETKQIIAVSSINIYNQLGQLVLVVPSAQNVSKVDVSSLASGNYFIKINSDKGTSNTKFIKQ